MEGFNPIIKKNSGNRGFTLVEMLVSITIFSLAMIVVMKLFTFSLYAEKMLTSHSQLVNETSYNLEHITRGIRKAAKSSQAADEVCFAKGTNYEITSHTSGVHVTSGIKFLDPNPSGTNDCVEYYMGYPGPAAGYPEDRAALMEWRRYPSGEVYDLPLTSPEVELLNFDIHGVGWDQNDDLQPRVTLKIELKGAQNQILKIQTSASQRTTDFTIDTTP